VVNEAFNRKLMQADQMAQRRVPRALQYGAIQQILFTMGIMLAMGVMKETGVLGDIAGWMDNNIHNVWLMGIGSGILSSFVDSFTVAITNISFYPVVENMSLGGSYMESFTINGIYWKIIAFCTAVGGCLLSVGSVSGLALMKMEHMRLGWYIKNLTLKVLAGMLVGLGVLWIELNYV
jgi:Na+/H+ antiporter NhaD/arsenite permease-like protein